MAQDLVGIAEIVKLLEVSRQYVDRLTREDPTFPEPEADLASGRVWDRGAVEAWARATGRIK